MACKPLFRNGKLFVPPPNDGSDFKELFVRLAAAGAGRPLGRDGFPPVPWTPELLAEAISQIDTNPAGVDLRTVQLWFQENEKGVSTTNVRWLARIFGCDDPVATHEWQMELIAAQSRLSAKRQEWRKAGSDSAHAMQDMTQMSRLCSDSEHPTEPAREIEASTLRQRLSLARNSEALFSRGSSLNLPTSVFAGFTALGFLSYIFGIHAVTYVRADGVIKQVGFLWTANWTSIFMVFLPLYFAHVSELVTFWKTEGRVNLAAQGERQNSDDAWTRNVNATSHSYWAVFSICLLFAGLFQWVGVSLIPLMKGGGNYATDWGSVAIIRPEIISVHQAIVFTGLAYLYMSICFYLFFAGLILLYTVIHDFWRIGTLPSNLSKAGQQGELNEISLRVLQGIFRCTVLGLLIAIVMKLQSAYLISRGENIVAWLVDDMSSAFDGHGSVSVATSYRKPTYYSSLLVTISTCFVFLFGTMRLGEKCRSYVPLWGMSAVAMVLVTDYFLINVFPGFSIFLCIGMLLAVFSFFDPGFMRWLAIE